MGVPVTAGSPGSMGNQEGLFVSNKVEIHLGSAVIGFGLILVLVGVIYSISAARFQAASAGAAADPQLVAQRLKPIGSVTLADESAAAAPAPEIASAAGGGGEAGGPGEAIYSKSCVACHGAGVAGAPKFGDKAAWEPRIAQGIDTLLSTAINGKGAMPPRGTCMDCSDDDLKAAIEYMTSNSQ